MSFFLKHKCHMAHGYWMDEDDVAQKKVTIINKQSVEPAMLLW
jgi:hypothetical protein